MDGDAPLVLADIETGRHDIRRSLTAEAEQLMVRTHWIFVSAVAERDGVGRCRILTIELGG